MDAVALEPLPYHAAICDFLKREDRKIWEWFASNKARREHADAVRFDMLKTTYRVEPAADPELYAAAQDAAQALSLDVPMAGSTTQLAVNELKSSPKRLLLTAPHRLLSMRRSWN